MSFISLRKMSSRPKRWLWANRIPLGALSLLEGNPGQGKTTLILDVAARVSTGRPMYRCTSVGGPAGVLLVMAEDDLERTVKPTLETMGADLDRIRAYTKDAAETTAFSLPENMESLEVAVAEAQAKLVVIDPLVAFLSGNTHSDQSIRKALGRLSALAERTEIAIVLVRHLRKSGSMEPLFRGTGSIGIIGAVRSALTISRDPTGDDPHQHVLVQTKNNLAEAVSLVFRTIKKNDKILLEWVGDCPLRSEDLCSAGGEPSELEEAGRVLYSILAEGPVPAQEAIKIAAAAGISKTTLYRAKKLLQVESDKIGSGRKSHWDWRLPDNESLLERFKEKDLDDLMNRLLNNGDEDPALPGDEWKNGQCDDEGWKIDDNEDDD